MLQGVCAVCVRVCVYERVRVCACVCVFTQLFPCTKTLAVSTRHSPFESGGRLAEGRRLRNKQERGAIARDAGSTERGERQGGERGREREVLIWALAVLILEQRGRYQLKGFCSLRSRRREDVSSAAATLQSILHDATDIKQGLLGGGRGGVGMRWGRAGGCM